MLGSVPDIDSSSRCRQAGSREVPPLQWVIVEVVGVQDAADGNARGDRHRGIQALAAIRIRDGDGAGRGRCRSNDKSDLDDAQTRRVLIRGQGLSGAPGREVRVERHRQIIWQIGHITPTS